MTDTLICIPTYNEKENIERIVPAVFEKLPDAHVLVVDDNSPDGTGKIADGMAQKDSRIQVFHRKSKAGLGRAYIAAFEKALDAGYEFIFEFDADFSHNPAYLPQMLACLKSGADVVIGSRRVPGGGVENWSLARRAISAGGSLYAKTVLGVPINDLTGGFNGFRAQALKTIDYKNINAAGFTFQVEIKYRASKKGLKVEEFPIIFPDRTHGQSKMNSKIFIEGLIGVWKLRLGL